MIVASPACRHTQVRTDTDVEPPTEAPTVGEGMLGPLDVLEIRVYDEPELSGEYRIDPDGTFTFPFLGVVEADGLTPSKLAKKLDEGLADGYLVDPSVTVYVTQYKSRAVVVLGFVKKPGSYPYTDGMTVVQAIAAAGGALDTGLLSRVSLTREVDGREVKETINVARIVSANDPDVPVQPRDIINVPRSPI